MMHTTITKISSEKAHKISKPLLAKTSVIGDKWYAIDKHWFDKFKNFTTIFDFNQPQKEDLIQEYPSKMDNSCLKCKKNNFELNKELNENEDFVWIHQELYQHFVEWFGLKDGSLTFERKVIAGTWRPYIERDPILIHCALCDCNGKPDFLSKTIVLMSKQSNLHELAKKNINKMILMVPEKVNLISKFWYRKLMDDKFKTISIDDIINIIITYHTSSILAQNDDNINSENVRIWSKGERMTGILKDNTFEKKGNEKEDIDAWICQNDRFKISFEEWIVTVDFGIDINFMIEICYDDLNWKRKYDPDKWRMYVFVGLKVDIYDIAYSKWYAGEIIEINGETKQVKVHYDGYSINYNEYIDINSYRIAQLRTHTSFDRFWSSFSSFQ